MMVFLVPNYYKQEAVESGLALELWLTRQGFEVEWAPDQRSGIELTPDLEDCGLVISLGGDGTLLRAARIVGYREIPILGLSYGHLGFLTAARPEDRNVLTVVGDALAGELHVSRRATLACDIVSVDEFGEERSYTSFALNDLALRVARCPIWLNSISRSRAIISTVYVATAWWCPRPPARRAMRFPQEAPSSAPITRAWSACLSRRTLFRRAPSSPRPPM